MKRRNVLYRYKRRVVAPPKAVRTLSVEDSEMKKADATCRDVLPIPLPFTSRPMEVSIAMTTTTSCTHITSLS